MPRIATLSHRRRIARRRITGIQFDGVATSVVIPDNAAYQDLHAGAMCIRAWIQMDGYGEGGFGRIFDKSDSAGEGWVFDVSSATGLEATIQAAALARSQVGLDEFLADGKLHQVCMQFDKGGDQNIYLWTDGIPVASYVIQLTAAGAIASDVGNNLYYGNRSNGTRTFDGLLGPWADISNILRYTNGVPFIPNRPYNPPIPDANTVWQTNSRDGAGTTLTDESATGVDGVITFGNGAWRKVRV